MALTCVPPGILDTIERVQSLEEAYDQVKRQNAVVKKDYDMLQQAFMEAQDKM
jgi:hypothetical protein